MTTLSQESRESILSMSQNGLSHKNIAAILGISKQTVTTFLVALGVQSKAKARLPRSRSRPAQESKPDIVWVHPDTLGVSEDWELEGLCRTGGYEPDLWFPKPTDTNMIRLVQRVCYRCPVIMECRATAVARGEPNGVWGGLTELQRRRMKKGTQVPKMEDYDEDIAQ